MSDKQKASTAGIIVIGNEILSGKVQDSNSYFLASELRSLGASVMRISVIPDDAETIGREAILFSKSFDYVFTSGGVGPTHDDITMAGIARGFGVKLVRNQQLEDMFRRRYGNKINEAVLTMAYIPAGAEIIGLGNGRFPLVAFRNIYIFPGIPKYLEEKFSLVRERFRSTRIYLKKFFLDAEEADVAAVLNKTVAENQDVAFGSYPILDNPEYRIIITAESRSEEALKKAADEFAYKIPKEIIVRTE